MKRMGTLGLTLRLYLSIAFLFFLIYVIVTAAGYFLHFGNLTFYAILAVAIVVGQYLLGPKLVEMTMKVRYVEPQEAPKLHAMVEELAMNAGIPKPKVGISEVNIPNAFAFGRTKGDGRVCVTRGILHLLDEGELKAVLGHEISHINHRDMAVITLISAVPLIFYYIFISTLFNSRDDNAGLIGVAALVGYLLSQLIVLSVSRIREYYADQGSVELGNSPHELASALYKLSYGSAVADEREVKEVEGVKAFFVNDVSSARDVVSDLQQLDLDRDGSISAAELEQLKHSQTKIGTGSKIMELLSTHPNMVKRVKRLSEMG
jgi:heat shock protein HtpX